MPLDDGTLYQTTLVAAAVLPDGHDKGFMMPSLVLAACL
jgi:hypothetical protein